MTRAYLGSYTSAAAGGSGIAIAAVESGTGALAIVDRLGLADPSYLALSADGRFLYAVNEIKGPGAVTAIALRQSGAVVLNTVAVQGNGPTHLCLAPDGRHVLTANYESGSVSVLSLASDGQIGAVSDIVQHTGSGPDPVRQSGPHAHQVLVDPSGAWVLVVDLGEDAVFTYQLIEGKLHQHARAGAVAGSGPRHLCFDSAGRRAYLASELDCTVTVCDWSPDSGELRLGETFAAGNNAGGPRNAPSAPVLSRDGRHLYLAIRGSDTIASFAVDGPGLRPLGTVACGGVMPRDLRLDPSGTRLYVANQDSGSVVWLDLDPETGLPGPVSGSLNFPAAACVLFS